MLHNVYTTCYNRNDFQNIFSLLRFMQKFAKLCYINVSTVNTRLVFLYRMYLIYTYKKAISFYCFTKHAGIALKSILLYSSYK